MTLYEYLQNNLISSSRFARENQITYRTLRKILDQEPVQIHGCTIKKILEATNGKVDLRHMLK